MDWRLPDRSVGLRRTREWQGHAKRHQVPLPGLGEAAQSVCVAILSHNKTVETMNFHWLPLIIIDFLWILMIPVDFCWILMIFPDYWGRACGSRSLQRPRYRRLVPTPMSQHVPVSCECSRVFLGSSIGRLIMKSCDFLICKKRHTKTYVLCILKKDKTISLRFVKRKD